MAHNSSTPCEKLAEVQKPDATDDTIDWVLLMESNLSYHNSGSIVNNRVSFVISLNKNPVHLHSGVKHQPRAQDQR